MSLVRQNPVPPGTYWIALEAGNPEALEVAQWLSRPNSMGHNFLSVETQRRGGFDVMILENSDFSEFPEQFMQAGFLLNEGAEGMGVEDTAQRPDPEPDPIVEIGDTVDSVKQGVQAQARQAKYLVPALLVGGLGIAALYFWRKSR